MLKLDPQCQSNSQNWTWRSKKSKGFIIKLNVEKAFDKISWRFIDFMLIKKNYPATWRKWVKACISNVQYSILINGRPRGKIVPSRGLRRGDAIWPFIFVLAMDYLSRLLTNMEKQNKIKGVKISERISILLTYLLQTTYYSLLKTTINIFLTSDMSYTPLKLLLVSTSIWINPLYPLSMI